MAPTIRIRGLASFSKPVTKQLTTQQEAVDCAVAVAGQTGQIIVVKPAGDCWQGWAKKRNPTPQFQERAGRADAREVSDEYQQTAFGRRAKRIDVLSGNGIVVLTESTVESGECLATLVHGSESQITEGTGLSLA